MSGDELSNVHPAKMAEAIWPHWSEGVPTKLCREVYRPASYRGGVYQDPQTFCQSLKLEWNGVYKLFGGARWINCVNTLQRRLPGIYARSSSRDAQLPAVLCAGRFGDATTAVIGCTKSLSLRGRRRERLAATCQGKPSNLHEHQDGGCPLGVLARRPVNKWPKRSEARPHRTQ